MRTKRGGNAFVGTFIFYLVINLRRCKTAGYLKVLQDVGRVGHAQPQHGSLGDLLHQPPQQSGQISADVSAVSSRVFARQPDLTHAL